MDNGDRVNNTFLYKTLRKAIANCLINTVYYGIRGVVIKRGLDKLILKDPGYIRTSKVQMRKDEELASRNKSSMSMFNPSNISERLSS